MQVLVAWVIGYAGVGLVLNLEIWSPQRTDILPSPTGRQRLRERRDQLRERRRQHRLDRRQRLLHRYAASFPASSPEIFVVSERPNVLLRSFVRSDSGGQSGSAY